ncbi:MAG TPA: carboxypeptidase-like regulatory domain-containing protein [Bdellovibrio sp.]|nr:carboxypeptidase-like regulatory domain-containing protein [Bdellovibrio sp.]
MKRLMMTALVPALLLGCGEHNKQQSQPPTNTHFWNLGADQITIKTADDQPVVGAQILIGDALNSPFEGNFLTTDSAGHAALPAGWNQPLPVTVQAAGYVRATYMAQEAGNLTFTLRPSKNGATQYEVKGAALNLPVKNGDDQIDFGLVMSAFTKLDLLSFDLNNVISPQTDRITAMGQDIDVPSNISLPRQSEKYSLFTITLDKPTYRLYFGQKGVNRLVSIRGRFPFRSTVDAMRGGKEFYELINQFQISGGGVRDINITGANSKMDIPSTELNFTDKKNVMAPAVRGDEMFLAIGVANQSGYLIPTDIKNVSSGKSLNLGTLAGADQQLLAVLKKTADMKSGDDRMSATLIPFAAQTTPKMLPLINSPSLVNPNEVTLPQFNTIDGVNPIATYSVISEQIEVQQGPAKVKIMNPRWEIYAQSWVTGLKIPQWPNETLEMSSNGKKRWEVSFIGSQTASQAKLGPAMIESATHVTHSSVTY